MKGVFIILDGVADLPTMSLGQKTPLDVAKTPNLDEIAKKSKMDYCYTVKEGVAPQSSNAVLSLFGHDPSFAPRGPLEALGAGIELKNGDLSFRTNFATIDNLEDRNILDRRAGRTLTNKEAKILAKAINSEVKLPHPFEFHSTVQHRGVLVIRGGFSENITNVDNGYGKGVVSQNSKTKLHYSKAVDDEDDSNYAAEILNSFVRQSFEVLDKHPINKARSKKGLYPGNIILCRDAGNKPARLKKPKGKWMGLGYMPLEIGICRSMKFELHKFNPPKLKKIDVYKNIYTTLNLAIKNATKMLKRNKNKIDYFYIHFKETDLPGHDNLPLEKIKTIELIDKKFFSFLKKFAKESKIVITADHTTACKLKNHTADPVPVLTYPHPKGKEIDNQRYTEEFGQTGKKIMGRKLLETTLL